MKCNAKPWNSKNSLGTFYLVRIQRMKFAEFHLLWNFLKEVHSQLFFFALGYKFFFFLLRSLFSRLERLLYVPTACRQINEIFSHSQRWVFQENFRWSWKSSRRHVCHFVLVLCLPKNIFFRLLYGRTFCLLFSRVHATLNSALSVHPSVRPSIGRSVCLSITLLVFYWFFFLWSF